LLNGEKMAKQTGNFLTLSDAVDIYSVDGTRFALADAGDSLDDANFSTKGADNAILRLYTQIKWAEEIIASKDLRTGSELIFADKVFDSEINKIIKETESHYEKANYRDAVQIGFFALQSARDNYRMNTADKGMKRDLILRFIEVQALILSPVTPHFSEYVWKLLGKSGSVRRASWPQAGNVDVLLLNQKDYLYSTMHNFRLRKEQHMKPRSKKETEVIPPPTKSLIQVAQAYPEWKQKILTLLKPLYESNKNADEKEFDKEVMKVLTADPEMKKQIKKAMPFVGAVKEQFQIQGISALDLKLSFDEMEFLQSNLEFIKKSIEMNEVEIKLADEETLSKERASPGQPNITFQ